MAIIDRIRPAIAIPLRESFLARPIAEHMIPMIPAVRPAAGAQKPSMAKIPKTRPEIAILFCFMGIVSDTTALAG